MLDIDGVENVFLYIADDVRADFTPDRVANLGQYHRTIAAGIHSPTSISSILTGTYEPQHGVGDFSNVVPSDVPHLVNDPDRETAFTNSMNYVRFDRDSEIDIISETLDVDHVDADRLESIEPPFVFVERAAGGHAPFVQPGELHTGEAYWKQRGNAPRSTFGAEYRTAIETDTDWFLSRLHLLDDRDLLEDTLVVYVSDHGELLGEQGMLGHTPPIHPRHAYVPTVFIHPDVEPRRVTDPVLRHVDILPTVSSVLGLEWDAPVPMAGVDLTTTEPPGHGCTFYRTDQTTPVGEVTVAFDAAWDATGGYVFPESGPLGRAALAGYHFLEAPWSEYAIRHAPAHLYNKLRGDRTHFAPGFSEAQARRYVAEAKRLDTSTAEIRRVEVPSDQLRDLGYME
jgi:arylsulfatase A-like enzyme